MRIQAELYTRDPEVFECARGLHAIVRIRGHGKVAEQIVFDPCFRRGHCGLIPEVDLERRKRAARGPMGPWSRLIAGARLPTRALSDVRYRTVARSCRRGPS